MKTGIIDEPVNYSKNEDDKLGIKDYAYALKTFIENTETPMTIGVQGEYSHHNWYTGGVGKWKNITYESFMEGIRRRE